MSAAFAAVSLACVFALGLRASYTDIKGHKVYNRDVICFAVLGIILQAICIFLEKQPLLPVLWNDAMALAAAVAFFALRIWAAGDAKLFFVMVLLIPYALYGTEGHELFPAFYVLGLVFTGALVYVVVESVILVIRDTHAGKGPKLTSLLPRLSVDTILAFVVAYLTANTADVMLLRFGGQYVVDNASLLLALNLLLATAALTLLDTRKARGIAAVALCVLRGALALLGIPFTLIHLPTILIVLGIQVIRSFTERYNYRTIKTEDICAGQVLARCSVVCMLPSSVKGLPKWTDETTRCRLTEEEAAAVRRWAGSKHGQPTILIVRHIPFAPFIFLGVLLFVGIRFALES